MVPTPCSGYEKAALLHTNAAWVLVGLWVFAIFWHFTTGEWKQYIPTIDKVDAMLKYYLTGIFTDAPHPFRTTPLRKHNPLQRLAYLFVKLLINPLIWISGFAYLFYRDLGVIGLGGLPLAPIAIVHTVAAFLMLIFFIAHIYLATAGHTPTAHIKAMITGYEDIEDEAAAPAGKPAG